MPGSDHAARPSTESDDPRIRTGAISGVPNRSASNSARAACDLVEIARGHAAWLPTYAESKCCWERSFDNEGV